MTQETCHGCGAPLRYHQHACDYCRRISLDVLEKVTVDGAGKVTSAAVLAIQRQMLLNHQPMTVLSKAPRPTLADFLFKPTPRTPGWRAKP